MTKVVTCYDAGLHVQVVIEFCEEHPDGAYEDLLNKIAVS